MEKPVGGLGVKTNTTQIQAELAQLRELLDLLHCNYNIWFPHGLL